MKTSDLTDVRLDWAVAKAGGGGNDVRMFIAGYSDYGMHHYSSNWAQGGPIIEREGIELIPPKDDSDPDWMACWYMMRDIAEAGIQEGPTPLIAAMRCFAALKLGDEVDVPEELL